MDSDKWWATPFEVHLAARKFNCIIHLFHSEGELGAEEKHYCFPPEKSARSPGYPRIFLKSQILHGRFWFQWYQTSPKLFRAKTLRSALSNWLRQDDVRPISFRYLGLNEHEFVSIFSKLILDAYKRNALQATSEVQCFGALFSRHSVS
jgi:hypothetical protein